MVEPEQLFDRNVGLRVEHVELVGLVGVLLLRDGGLVVVRVLGVNVRLIRF
jgi:hypothetical protein